MGSYNLGVDGVDRVIGTELSGLPICNHDNSASITPITQITPITLFVLVDPADIFEVGIYYKFLWKLVQKEGI